MTGRTKRILSVLGVGVLAAVALCPFKSGPAGADGSPYAAAISAEPPLLEGLVVDGQAIQGGLSGVTTAPDAVGVDMVVNGTAFWFARWAGFPGALRESGAEIVAADRILLEVDLGADAAPIDAAIQTYSGAELSPSCSKLTTFALHDGRNVVTLAYSGAAAIRVALSTPAPRPVRVRRVALLPPGSPETAPTLTASFDQPQPGSGPIATSLSWAAAPRLDS